MSCSLFLFLFAPVLISLSALFAPNFRVSPTTTPVCSGVPCLFPNGIGECISNSCQLDYCLPQWGSCPGHPSP